MKLLLSTIIMFLWMGSKCQFQYKQLLLPPNTIIHTPISDSVSQVEYLKIKTKHDILYSMILLVYNGEVSDKKQWNELLKKYKQL